MKTKNEQERKQHKNGPGQFLHRHPLTERMLGLDANHVIVDLCDYETALSELRKPSEDLVQKIVEILYSILGITKPEFYEDVLRTATEIAELMPSTRSQEDDRLLHRLKLSIMAHPDYRRGQKGDEWHDLVDSIVNAEKQIQEPDSDFEGVHV